MLVLMFDIKWYAMVYLQPFDKLDESISMDRCHIGKPREFF